jgi:phosphatidylserine/phosphatidylglycerophosphate/cardiolipin synthase-like enzyme
MNSPLHQLNYSTLISLARALQAERLHFPCSVGAIGRHVPRSLATAVSEELNRLAMVGITQPGMTAMLNLLAEERAIAQNRQDTMDLVWTGEDVVGAESRDTAVVIQELFQSAQKSVLISSYALDEKSKSQEIFQPLAARMNEIAELQVRMFLNVPRKYQDTTPESILLREFAEHFRDRVWPGQRFPEVFYDPRSLAITFGKKACLHAKCVVIDEEQLLITSANFTEAAHKRNIEAGILVRDAITARAMRSQFEMLVSKGSLCRLPGL